MSWGQPRRRHCRRRGELLGAHRNHVPSHTKQKEDYHGDQRDEANTIGQKERAGSTSGRRPRGGTITAPSESLGFGVIVPYTLD